MLSPSAGFVPSVKNASPNSFCSEKLRYAGRCTNTSNITILNETTRGRATFSSFLHQTQHHFPRAGPFGVATDLAAYLSFTPLRLDSLTTRVEVACVRTARDELRRRRRER